MALISSFSNDGTIECGCDEAGRGALAGPVFAAAVILPSDYHHPDLNDSKQISAQKREQLREEIIKEALAYRVISISVEEIDKINILNASFKGMNEAVKGLSIKPELLLIDGPLFRNSTTIPYRCIVKGDALYYSIAAASILAKTFRDEHLIQLAAQYPQYGWEQNKGYATKQHQEAILKYGFTPLHRRSFHLKGQLKFDF